MITCVFRGRLGNHMGFIYSLFKFCKDRNIDFNKVSFSKYENSRVRKNYYVNECFPLYSSFLQSRFNKNYIDVSKLRMLLYKDFSTFDIKDDFFIFFYSTVMKTFNDLDLIEQLFYNKDIYDKVLKERNYLGNNLAIHIRRDDFLIKTKNQEKWKITYSIGQYNEMIKNNKDKFDKIIIFSDGIKWCKYYLNREFRNKVIFDESKLAYEGMIRMSSCKDIIMNPNSTYSLWGKNLLKITNKIYNK